MGRGLIALGAGAVYAFAFLWLNGDIDRLDPPSWGVRVAGDPGIWLNMRSPFRFEAVALLALGPLIVLVSPLNMLLAGALGWLLALNVHGALALHSGAVCAGTWSARHGALAAALPALLAGSACCAPSLLVLLGIPALGALAGAIAWLVPLSVLLLVAARVWQRHLGAPRWPAVRHGG